MKNLATAVILTLSLAASLHGQQLELHYINVGWGSSVLVKGPDGTTVLLEAGNTGKGTAEVVPYLQSIGLPPSSGLDYIVGGHQHCDHLGGLDEVMQAGYNVRVKQYNNGSTYTSSCVTGWSDAAAATTAGRPVAMTPGTVIPLGNGATITCVAANGKLIGGGTATVSDENDRSIALLIQYGGFDYLWASDLGGGSDSCTGRSTGQSNIESVVVQTISPGGAYPMITPGGIDVLNVNHHGSESSTNPDWMDYSVPAVAVIATGAGQTTGWDLPRIDVVENVLLAQASACVTAPPTFVVQTEEGSPAGTLTSKAGYCVGNIKITTDGANIFTVTADGQVNQGPNELVAAALPQSFTLDDAGGPGGDTTAPTTSITAPASGATVSGTTTVTAAASDNVGVTQVEIYLDNVLQATFTGAPYSWSWNTTTATNGAHTLTSRAYDAAGNSGNSTVVSVTVSNAAADTTSPTTSITAPANGATVSGTTAVTASASDNVGVTRVEFFLDNVLTSTSTTAPYSWSWNTTTATNATHSLTSKAYDAAGNVGSSAVVTVTVSNAPPVVGTNIGGYRLNQANSTLAYVIPAGTVIPSKGYVIVARNATKTAFESFWGITLPSNVVFINSGDGMPQINGDEKYTLYNAAGTRIEVASIAMDAAGGYSYRRSSCGGASKASSWIKGTWTTANPGSGAITTCNKGVFISEFSDALGTGNYVYEFVELHNDK